MLVPPYPFELHHWHRPAADFAAVVAVAAALLDFHTDAAVAAAGVDDNAVAVCMAKALPLILYLSYLLLHFHCQGPPCLPAGSG